MYCFMQSSHLSLDSPAKWLTINFLNRNSGSNALILILKVKAHTYVPKRNKRTLSLSRTLEKF